MTMHEVRDKRRYDVFISSTFSDLECVRSELIDATLRAEHYPIAMEHFHGGPKDLPLISKKIKEADIFVIVVGSRLGSSISTEELAFIQKEYLLALDAKKPVLAYLLDDQQYRDMRKLFEVGDAERAKDKILDEFRELIQRYEDGSGRLTPRFKLDIAMERDGDSQVTKGSIDQRSCRHKSRDLLDRYQLDLVRVVREDLGGKGGWVEGGTYDGQVLLSTKITENRFFFQFISELEKFGKLATRLTKDVPELKSAVARKFLEDHLGNIELAGVSRMFFESGSSIALLSEEVFRLSKAKEWIRNYWSTVHVETNNFLTYLYFTLMAQRPAELFPPGSPDDKYGATFGDLVTLTEPSTQRVYSQGLLNFDKVKEKLNPLTERFRENYTTSGLVLMTVSGLDIEHGPHVGSYPNAIFKNGLFAAKVPMVMFLDENKTLRKPFDKKTCYRIFDKKEEWAAAINETPFAIAIGCSGANVAEEVRSKLKLWPFDEITIHPDDSGRYAVYAFSKLFLSRFVTPDRTVQQVGEPVINVDIESFAGKKRL